MAILFESSAVDLTTNLQHIQRTEEHEAFSKYQQWEIVQHQFPQMNSEGKVEKGRKNM